eukprot:6919874-Prymnesium_polylepis.1
MQNRLNGHVARPPVRSSTRLRECAGATLPQPRRRRFPTPLPPVNQTDVSVVTGSDSFMPPPAQTA